MFPFDAWLFGIVLALVCYVTVKVLIAKFEDWQDDREDNRIILDVGTVYPEALDTFSSHNWVREYLSQGVITTEEAKRLLLSGTTVEEYESKLDMYANQYNIEQARIASLQDVLNPHLLDDPPEWLKEHKITPLNHWDGWPTLQKKDRCPYCNRKNKQQNDFCEGCGAPL